MKKAKAGKKGTQIYTYWMASWSEGDRTRNVHLGSCKKLDEETALQKARRLKAEALGILGELAGEGRIRISGDMVSLR